MKKNEVATAKAKELLQCIAISKDIINKSLILPEDVKKGMLTTTGWVEESLIESLIEGKVNQSLIKSSMDVVFGGWNAMINLDAELFWWEIETQKLNFERKEALNSIIGKGRFLNISQAMDARNNWADLRKSGFLDKRFTTEQLTSIENIIDNYEKKRYELLQKCLVKGKIAKSDYYKFGETIAYMHYCGLVQKYFTPEEERKLIKMHNTFN